MDPADPALRRPHRPWAAFRVVTVIAFFAIVATGRHPARLSGFKLGVLRWSWRVAYYGYNALGTDRYRPFTLAEEPDYPATLDIAYPDQMSRGLVLVKWWLLALPHYHVLAILVGARRDRRHHAAVHRPLPATRPAGRPVASATV